MRKPFRTRPRQYFTGIALFAVLLFMFLLYKGLVILKENDLPCLDSETIFYKDALPSAEHPGFSPKEKSIFFLATSCRSELTVRQACAVEAAARAHPKREIYVLFSAPVTEYELKTSCLALLHRIPNVKFLRVHAAEFSRAIQQSTLLNYMIHTRYRLSVDILKIVTLNKWGGIYLDTDMIVTKSFEDLPPNFVVKENADEVSSAILSFAKDKIGTRVTNQVIEEISKEYIPSKGAKTINDVLRRNCPKVVGSPAFQAKSINNCKGVMIFNSELLYAKYFWDVPDIFMLEDFYLNRPSTYHMSDFVSQNGTIIKGTVYELIAEAFCPTIHNIYPDEFSIKVINDLTRVE